MREILSYWQYNYLICFGADWNYNIHIVGSSNRAIKTDVLLRVEDDIETKDLPMLSYSVFSKYFKLLSKGKDQLLKNETATLASIRDLFKRIRATFLKEKGISMDTVQILFIMPHGWTEEHYKDRMREFFLDMGWITAKDSKSKLIMIPAIQMLADYFQNSPKHKQHLDRERTSVLFSAKPASDEGGRVQFSYTFFKMQSAKALVTVSKTLASSDFFLVPSIMSSKSLHLANLDNVMHKAIRRILARVTGKDQKCVLDNNIMKEDDPAWTIVCHLPFIHESKFGLMSNRNQETFLEDVILENQHHLQDLKNWTCSQLLAAISEDVHVKHYFKQVSSFFKGALDEYGAVKNSPDGIQHALFYSNWSSGYDASAAAGQDYSDYIVQILIEENIIQSGKDFSGINLLSNARFAMQQSYKMIQIANAILPPVIVGEEEQNDSTFPAHKHTDSLIAPNSFYVQANVTDTQIGFILNKVIEVLSSKTGTGLFTIQERSIEIEDIADTASCMLWNHYQSMVNLEEEEHELFQCCQDHDTMVLLSSHYNEFKKNARKLIESWFAAEETLPVQELDAYHLVLVDQQCTCALKLSQRLLLEVGLKPVIADIATIIKSALFSNDFFGLYQLSALITKKNMKTIKNHYFSYTIDQILEQALVRLLQMQHSRLLLLFHAEHVASNALQFLGQGVYSQVSSMTYTFKIELWPKKDEVITFGLLENGVCKRIPLVPVKRKKHGSNSFMLTYSGLTKGENLPLNGIDFTFFIKGCSLVSIEAHASDHPEKSTNRHIVASAPFSFLEAELCSPITLKLLPENYSSNIKFKTYLSLASPGQGKFTQIDMSKQSDRREPHVFEVKKSFNIIERLSLKK